MKKSQFNGAKIVEVLAKQAKNLTSGTCCLSPRSWHSRTAFAFHPTPQGADDKRSETFTPPVRWAERPT